MPWLEVGPGHYQRHIGENEKFIKAIGDRAHASGREHWSITSKASFILTNLVVDSDLSSKFRQVWEALRFEHPSIAVTAEDGMLNYIAPNTDILNKWAGETFFVYNEKINADDLIASFKPSPYVTAHYLSQSSQLILHTAHWRTDGFGALQLLSSFFAAYATVPLRDPFKLPWGQEVDRLVPSIEEVLELPVCATPKIKSSADQYIATLAYMKGAVGLSYQGDGSTLPSGTRSARLRLSQSATESIIKNCRALNISVLSAVHASLAAVTYAGAPINSKNKHYTSTIRLSLRPYLPEPYNTSRFASGLYTGGYMFKVPYSQSWAENAKTYNGEYRRGVTKEFLQARRQYALNVQNLFQIKGPPEGSPPSEVDISSVDDAELLVSPVHEFTHGTLEILDVSIGVETLTRQMYCFTWMFRGQMEFNLVYNEAFYDSMFAARLLDILEEILRKELQV